MWEASPKNTSQIWLVGDLAFKITSTETFNVSHFYYIYCSKFPARQCTRRTGLLRCTSWRPSLHTKLIYKRRILLEVLCRKSPERQETTLKSISSAVNAVCSTICRRHNSVQTNKIFALIVLIPYELLYSMYISQS